MKFLLLFFISFNLYSNNLQLIQRDVDSGFEIYRTGKPSASDIKTLCKIGVQEIMVLSGNADDNEYKYQDLCPELKVIYDIKQNPKIPVTADFLDFFDSWVIQAKKLGKKIAFRCNCGCHRTGRLAAYYQMKYQGLTAKDAKTVMKKNGKYMFLYPSLFPQVRAMEDYILGRECGEKSKYCIKE